MVPNNARVLNLRHNLLNFSFIVCDFYINCNWKSCCINLQIIRQLLHNSVMENEQKACNLTIATGPQCCGPKIPIKAVTGKQAGLKWLAAPLAGQKLSHIIATYFVTYLLQKCIKTSKTQRGERRKQQQAAKTVTERESALFRAQQKSRRL